MKFIIMILTGLFSGYIINNLKYKKISEIISDLLEKGDYWLETIQNFVGETIREVEGKDFETIKFNMEYFIDLLIESIEEILEIENFDEKIKFVEEKIISIAANLAKKVEEIEKSNKK